MKLLFLFSTLAILLVSSEAKDNYYRPSSTYPKPAPSYGPAPGNFNGYLNNYNGGYNPTPFPGYNPSYQPPMPGNYPPSQNYNYGYPNPAPGYNSQYQTARPATTFPYAAGYGTYPTQRPGYSAPYMNYNNGYPANMPNYNPTYTTPRPFAKLGSQPAYFPTERPIAMPPKKTNYYPSPDLRSEPAVSYLLAGPMGYYMCHNHGQQVTPFTPPPSSYNGQGIINNFRHETYSSYPLFSQTGLPGNYVYTPPVPYQAGYGYNQPSAPMMQSQPSPVPYVIGPHGQPCTFIYYQNNNNNMGYNMGYK